MHAKLRIAEEAQDSLLGSLVPEEAQDSLSNLLQLREDDLNSLNRTLELYAQGFAAATRASSDPPSETSPTPTPLPRPPLLLPLLFSHNRSLS